MRSLKEKGWKRFQMMLSKFTILTDVCMAGWQELPPSHTNVC